ncbi:TlpA disulfide reductase family protein [Alphaproteobacteria bacterium LSUCC0684]
MTFCPAAITSRRQFLAMLAATSGAAVMPDTALAALDTMKPLALPSPNTAIEFHDGTSRRLADFAPTPLLVNFWASWCPPCVHELPSLMVLDQALREEGMAVLLIGLDRKGRKFGQAFLEDRGITIGNSAFDPPGELARALSIRVMPTSFLISSTGVIRGKVEGPLDWGRREVISAVSEILRG